MSGWDRFEVAVAQAISDALPLIDVKLPMTPVGASQLRSAVDRGVSRYLVLGVMQRAGHRLESARPQLLKFASMLTELGVEQVDEYARAELPRDSLDETIEDLRDEVHQLEAQLRTSEQEVRVLEGRLEDAEESLHRWQDEADG